MKKKKTITLILAIVLSAAVFVQNVQMIRVVRAAEEDAEAFEDEAPPEEAPDAPTEPTTQAQPEPQDQDDDDRDDDDERERQRQEAERQRQEALDKAAEENNRQHEEQSNTDEGKAAQQLADKKEAEGEQAAGGAGTVTPVETYKLTANPISINFGEEPVGKDRQVYRLDLTNASSTDVDFTFSFANKTGAFTCDLSSGQSNGNTYHVDKNGTVGFSVSMRNNLNPGGYEDALVFSIVKEGVTTGSAKVKLKGAVSGGGTAQIKSVVVSPQNYKLSVGDSYQFSATVKDTDGNEKGVSQDVTWEVRGAKSTSTNISGSGMLTIASDETSTGLVVYAFSQAAPSVYGTSNVTPKKGGFNVSVAADPAEGGTVTGGGSVVQGGDVNLTAIPNSNYTFVGWIRDGKTVSTATNYKITNVQSSFGVTAKFDRKYVTVTLKRNNEDGGKVSGGGKIRYGENTTITAKAHNGYVFTGWKEDGKIISKDASYKLKNLKEDREIKGMFERTSHTITLAANPAEGGTVSGGGTFKINEGTTVKAVPNSGYSFVGWEVNGQIVNRNATVKIDKLEEDYQCTAIFVKTGISTFEISAGVATTGGSISPSGKRVVAQGQNITYTITPKAGYAILAVAVDNQQIGAVNSYTFSNVQGNHTIAAAFLLTDAGKAKASASGKTTQTQKVQKVDRTAANTATADSTVSIEDALSGEGGDDYVEVMDDLDNITVPTDEELGVTDEDGSYSDVAAMLGVSTEEAYAMAEAGNRDAIARAAFYSGALGANAENELEPTDMYSVDYTTLSTDELMQLPEENLFPSYTNLDVVVENMLSTDDMIGLIDGGSENVSVSLSKMNNNDVAPAVEKIMKNAVGQKIIQYFDLSVLKTTNGYTENVTELDDAMEVVIEIPKEYYKAGKTYSVLRVHNGELKVLPDLDDNPRTITFRTDRFSSYAIAMQTASSHEVVLYLTLGALISLLVGLTCFLILILHQAKVRRERRRARAAQRRKEI